MHITQGEQGVSTAAELSTVTIKEAANAEITLWAGTTAAQTITSTSNTFTDLLPGVSVTVTAPTAADAAPVSLIVARDDKAVTTLAKDLVTAINDIFTLIKASTKVTSTRRSTSNAGSRDWLRHLSAYR